MLRKVAELRRLPLAAEGLDAEAIEISDSLHRPDLANQLAFERARSAIERDDPRRSARLVTELRTRWYPRQSAEDQAWALVDLMHLEGDALRTSNPAASIRILNSALGLASHDENETRSTPIRFARARSRLAGGDTAAALAELDQIVRRIRLRGGPRLTVFESARLTRVLEGVANASARVLRARGDALGALSVR